MTLPLPPSSSSPSPAPTPMHVGDGPDGLDAPRPELDDRPPVLGSWRAVYGVVLGALVIVVLALWALTRAYA